MLNSSLNQALHVFHSLFIMNKKMLTMTTMILFINSQK